LQSRATLWSGCAFPQAPKGQSSQAATHDARDPVILPSDYPDHPMIKNVRLEVDRIVKTVSHPSKKKVEWKEKNTAKLNWDYIHWIV